MPRKFLKRFMPDHRVLQQHPYLQKISRRLIEPKLWHLNRKSVAGATALGLFIAFMPILGQMIIAATLAILFRVNLPISISAVWISNPLTMVPIYFYAYEVGAWVLQKPIGHHGFSLSWEWLRNEFLLIWQPLLLGCFIYGIIAAILGVLFIRTMWRLVVIRRWLQRRHKR